MPVDSLMKHGRLVSLSLLVPAISAGLVVAAAASTANQTPAARQEAVPGTTTEQSDARAALRAARNACVAAPTRDCALTVALRTVAEEDLAIERAKVLIAVAESLAHVGDMGIARRTLRLGLEEAESIGISVATDAQLAGAAPVYAMLGSDDAALRTSRRIEDAVLRDRSLGDVVRALGTAGKADLAVAALDTIDQPVVRLLATIDAAEAALAAGWITPARAFADKVPDFLDPALARSVRLQVEARLSAVQARLGAVEPARTELIRLVDEVEAVSFSADKARVLAAVARAWLALEDDAGYDRAIRRATAFARRVRSDTDREVAVHDVALARAAAGDVSGAVEELGGIDDLRSRSRAIQALAVLPLSNQARGELADFIEGSLSLSNGSDSSFERDLARYRAVTALTELGQVAAAVRVIDSIEDDDTQAQAFGYLARAL